MNATKTHREITATAREKCDPSARQVGEMAHLDKNRQGDVYIWKLDALPAGCTLIRNPERQIAVGDSRGSRHLIDDLSKVTMYRLKNPNALQGPIVESKTGFAAPIDLTHPEHGDHHYPPGIYFFTYQRMHADELKRTQD